MDHSTDTDRGLHHDPHAGHNMPDMRGHNRHAGHSVAVFRDKFWLSLALTVPVIFWSSDVQHWLGYTAPSFPGSKFIAPILGTIVFVYGGLVFVRGARNELADHKPGMMTLITGESKPVSKGPGAKVIAGTVASGGSLRVRIAATGERTTLSGIMRLVAAAQASGSRTQALADRAAAILFYVAVAAGAITFAYWWFSGDKAHALIRTATVLIIACPHALGLTIPLVIAISTSLGAQNGLLVKDRLALERARNLDIVIFDKTGTLTRGSPGVSDVVAAPGTKEDDLIARAAAVESNSEHPLAKAIVTEAKRRGLRQLSTTNFKALSGRRAKALVEGTSIEIGGPRLLDEAEAEVLPADKASAVKRFQQGGSEVAMVGDGVNDAPALATADVGIAIGAGTDVAIESAGIVLVRSDPRDVVSAIELSRASYRKMVQNLIWATAYNIVAIPAAGGLFERWGLNLPMSVGAVAMNLSTIIVAVNAQLLRRLRLRRH